jgi:hypothetical protein
VPFAQCLPRGNLGEGGDAAEPDVVDPSPGLGDGRKQDVPAFGFHHGLCVGLMKDALHGREARCCPRQRDHGRGMDAGSRISEAGIFTLNQCFPRGNETDLQCLRPDKHARDMAFDQLVVRKAGRRLFSHRCKVPADTVTDEALDVGSRHPGNTAGFGLAILQQRLRDIIPVVRALLIRMRQAHAVAAVVEKAAGQKSDRTPEPDLPGNGVGGEFFLHGVEQIAGEDRLMLAPVHLSPIGDLADVEPCF